MGGVKRGSAVAVATLALGLASCGPGPALAPESGYGPNPTLPAPHTRFWPVVKVAPVVGWKSGATPVAAPGWVVKPFATGLNHPRWIYVLPDGDVLVAESNAPPSKKVGGLRDWIEHLVMKKAGAGVKSANRITLLRDQDGDGRAETRSVFLHNLSSPFGMALVGPSFYVANADSLIRFPYMGGETQITAPSQKVTDLPGGPINHHWTKNVVAAPDGSRLYVSVGSNSNVAENGMAVEDRRAAILEVDPLTGESKVYASGLRNPVGMDFQPETGALWAAVNERDEIGNDVPPDYMTAVKPGGFYGWPYSYFGAHVDKRVKPQRPDLVARAIFPDYALGAHTASLGLTFYRGDAFPAHYKNGAFIGQHGSWNRVPKNGYQVLFVPFTGGKPSGMPEKVLTGFLTKDGKAQGRPVGVAVDRQGALLVADDVGDVIWRVTRASGG